MSMFDSDLGARSDFDERVIELGDFAPDLPIERWAARVRPGDPLGPVFWRPIETLSPTAPTGLGRTNLTLVRPTVVQTDAQTPYVGFDRRETPNRDPALSVHFEPAAYGIGTTGTYVATFLVESWTPVALRVSAYAAGGTVEGAGTRTVTGPVGITVTLRDLPPYGGWVSLEQPSGDAWSWYSTRIAHPPLVFGT